MTRVPRRQNPAKDLKHTAGRMNDLATGAMPTNVQDGGYGRNRNWAKMGLAPGVSVTNGGFMRWCIVGDEVMMEAFGGKLDLTPIYPNFNSKRAGFRPLTIAQIHKHGAPSAHWQFMSPAVRVPNYLFDDSSYRTLMQVNPFGQLQILRPAIPPATTPGLAALLAGARTFNFKIAFYLG